MVPFESLGMVSYSHSIPLTCIVSEIKRDIGRKSRFFIPLHSTVPLGGSPSEYCRKVWYGKNRMVWLPEGEIISLVVST